MKAEKRREEERPEQERKEKRKVPEQGHSHGQSEGRLYLLRPPLSERTLSRQGWIPTPWIQRGARGAMRNPPLPPSEP